MPDAVWKLEDAKARFSELVRRARSEGPQRVTVRGRDAVVVVSAEEMARLAGPAPREPHWTEGLRGLSLWELDVTRQPADAFDGRSPGTVPTFDP